MVTVLRADGQRVIIYLNGHLPAHVHVCGDGEVKINLLGPDQRPELVWADDATHGEVRRAMRLAVEHRVVLLQRWEEIHGRIE